MKKHSKYPGVWLLRAETDTCMNKSVEEQYTSYEKFLEYGGKKSEVSQQMRVLEKNMYSAEIRIKSSNGSDLNWSKIQVTLPSERFIKKEDGVYILQYTKPQKYKLTINSSDPAVESKTLVLQGKGKEVVDIVLKTFTPADLIIPKYDSAISLQIFPKNKPQEGMDAKEGTYSIVAGPLSIKSVYQDIHLEYSFDVGSNSRFNILSLPWGYTIAYEGSILKSEFLDLKISKCF